VLTLAQLLGNKSNSWFGQDKLMTGMALALHEQLKDEGVPLIITRILQAY
jgi:hypothetical protein